MAISGRQLRFCRGFPVIRPGTARLPRPLRGLAMTRQGGTAVHQRPYAVELSRTRRSLTAATGPVGTGSILTIVCAYRQHCAGRSMPRPSAKRQSDGQFDAMHRSRRHAPLICHCEEAAGRRGNLGKAVTILPGLSCDPAGYCEIATAPSGPRNDTSGWYGGAPAPLRSLIALYRALTERRYRPRRNRFHFNDSLCVSTALRREGHAPPLQ